MENYIIQEWVYLHLDKQLSHNDIASLYNVNRNTVQRNLSKLGISSINYQNKINHNILTFDKIDDEESAYWLGFIYADGCISNDGRFSVGLQHQDYWHLSKLRDYLMLDTPIYYNKNTKSFKLSTRNKTLVNNLMKLGVIPNKSLILTFPHSIDNNLIRHFIRGYFDGDGCISIYNKQMKTKISKIVCISLLGTKEFLEGIRLYSPIEFGKYVKNNNSENTLVLSTAHKKAYLFIDWLYSDSKIYLDRKFEKFKKVINMRNGNK